MAIEHFLLRERNVLVQPICIVFVRNIPVEMAHPVKPEPKFFITDVLFEKGIDYYETNFSLESLKLKFGARKVPVTLKLKQRPIVFHASCLLLRLFLFCATHSRGLYPIIGLALKWI